MRNFILVTLLACAVCAVALGRSRVSPDSASLSSQAPTPAGPQAPPPSTQTPTQPPQSPQSQPAVPAGTPGPPHPQAPSTPPTSGFVVVIDPAHGGTDTGARGANGIVEKDVVLQFARNVRADLERQGYRVVMTRNDDSNPSYDDRASAANVYRDAIFISLHISSTGMPGTARAYFYQFWTPFAAVPSAPSPSDGSSAPLPPAAAPRSDLTVWEEAQRSYADSSRRLADGVQLQLDQVFAGSPASAAGVEVRGLRSVTAPAVAVELSSVAVSQAAQLYALAPPLAASIVKAVAAYRTGNAAGAK